MMVIRNSVSPGACLGSLPSGEIEPSVMLASVPGESIALDPAKRNDGYLVLAHDPAIVELCREGLITIREVGDCYVIARAVHIQTSVHVRYTASKRRALSLRERPAMVSA